MRSSRPRIVGTLTVLSAALIAMPVNAAALCTFSKKFSCGPEACSEVNPTTWAVVDFERRLYQRCDTRGCDTYDMTTSRSGIFINIEFGPGTLAKATDDLSIFMEVVTGGVSTLTSFGKCEGR